MKTTIRCAIVSHTMAAVLLLSSSCMATPSSTVVESAAICGSSQTIDQCPSSGWISTLNVTGMQFSARGSGYKTWNSADSYAIVKFWRPNGTWACFGGSPCRVIRFPNTPPDAFGNVEHWTQPSALVSVPTWQRIPKTQLRLEPAQANGTQRGDEDGINFSKTTIQLFYQ